MTNTYTGEARPLWIRYSSSKARRPALRFGAVIVWSTSIALTAPIALPILPILPPETLTRYMDFIGLEPLPLERQTKSPLPQHLADQHGWPELVSEVTRALESLEPPERGRAVLFTANYGEASAILLLGLPDLPPVHSGHNHYWLWGPPAFEPEVVVTVGIAPEDLEPKCQDVKAYGRLEHPYAMPYEQRHPILICRALKRPIREMWPALKHFN